MSQESDSSSGWTGEDEEIDKRNEGEATDEEFEGLNKQEAEEMDDGEATDDRDEELEGSNNQQEAEEMDEGLKVERKLQEGDYVGAFDILKGQKIKLKDSRILQEFMEEGRKDAVIPWSTCTRYKRRIPAQHTIVGGSCVWDLLGADPLKLKLGLLIYCCLNKLPMPDNFDTLGEGGLPCLSEYLGKTIDVYGDMQARYTPSRGNDVMKLFVVGIVWYIVIPTDIYVAATTLTRSRDITKRPNKEYFSYERITLYPTDMDTLKEGGYLSDPVINMMMKYLTKGKDRIYSVDSFFVEQLLRGGSYFPGKVRNTFLGLEVSALNCILVPVCKNHHWFLVEMDVKIRMVKIYDSLGGQRDEVADGLKRYAQEHILTAPWAVSHVDLSVGRGMRREKIQNDGFNCGVFVIFFAKALCAGVSPTTITREEVTKEGRGWIRSTLNSLR